MTIERTIFANLIQNEDYARKVIPFLQADYFTDYNDRAIYEVIDAYFNKYNTCPTLSAIDIDLSNKSLNEQAYSDCKEIISKLSTEEKADIEWLLDNTEKLCKDKAVYNAIMTSITILDDKTNKSKLDKGAIPQLLQDALGVCFDNHIGHDYLEDYEERFEFYHRKEERIPFDIDLLNQITNGGLPKKTLNMILAGTNVGKTLMMCHMAAFNLMNAHNVLYITLEMAEEEISRRIDANLLDIPIAELETIPKELYDKKIERVKSKTKGKLIVHEYPTASAGANNFRHLLNELKIKKNFVPDIIYVDYINICMSSRLKMGSNVNSYTLIKAIAEELRGLAVEYRLPLVSATQTNRDGFASSDIELGDTSESFGLPMTVDFMIGLSTTEELEALNQFMVKQLKSRYGDKAINKRFVIGVDRMKMRLYNAEQSAQDNILDGPNSNKGSKDTSVFDQGKFMTEEMERTLSKPKSFKDKFKDFQ